MKGLRTMNNKTKELQDMYEVYRREYGSEMEHDYYYYDEEKYAMIGQETHKEYHLGEKVKVRVMDTDKIAKTIDFELFEEGEDEAFLEYMRQLNMHRD